MKKYEDLIKLAANNDNIEIYQLSEDDDISIYVFCSNEQLEESDYDFDALGFLEDNGFDINEIDFIESDESVANYYKKDNCYIFHTTKEGK